MGGSQLRLPNNKLTRFEAEVYQNVLEQQDPNCDPSVYACGVIIDNSTCYRFIIFFNPVAS